MSPEAINESQSILPEWAQDFTKSAESLCQTMWICDDPKAIEQKKQEADAIANINVTLYYIKGDNFSINHEKPTDFIWISNMINDFLGQAWVQDVFSLGQENKDILFDAIAQYWEVVDTNAPIAEQVDKEIPKQKEKYKMNPAAQWLQDVVRWATENVKDNTNRNP